MAAVETCKLPENALLIRYREDGAYTDCYSTQINQTVTLSDYVEAFYTTRLFKLERAILKWAVSKPSTDEDARSLAEAKVEKFAAWKVEARQDNQILLSDYRGRTRSWLMCTPGGSNGDINTRLYFGSAVVPVAIEQTGGRRMGHAFNAMLLFHNLYSRVLLRSAASRLSS